MEKNKQKPAKRRREWGMPPKDGENKYVLSKRESHEHYGRIVAVLSFPTLGRYSRAIAVDESIEGLKRDLCILGWIEHGEVLPALIRPELDVFCYVVVARYKPEIIRRGGENGHL